MGVKKIIHNAFEQVREVGVSVVKSSAKQVTETFSPWDMIRNSFIEGDAHKQSFSPEQKKEGKNNTPLNFESLEKSYAKQDQQKISLMKQRLFQVVKRDEERTIQKNTQVKSEKERQDFYEENEKRKKAEEQRRQNNQINTPEGKSGRGSALSRKKRKATEPQPAETKPGSSKQ